MPIAAILLTGTRSGWGALGFAALLFILLWDVRIVPIFLICCALAFAALPTVSPQIYKRVMTIFMSSDHSMSYRDTIMNATMPILKENLISGIGLGSANFSRYLANNYEFELTPPHSHNVFVQV
ncbi:MAG: O-antigen ligase family protein [Clostridia bacterium]|nr:O-antigen ligase family protein [Clostridia bacterium]